MTNHSYKILDNKVNHYKLQNLITYFEKYINDINNRSGTYHIHLTIRFIDVFMMLL